MLYSIFRASIIASALALPLDGNFAAWKAEFGKTYDTVEGEASALKAYIQNDHIIEEHNAKKLSYMLGHNAFSDMTWEEFSATHMGELYLNRAPKNVERGLVWTNTTALPDAVDWVAKGAVTPVKNQGRCGSCWAFSTTGSLEGAYQIATGKLTSLSEEDLVQCDTAHDLGCRGGLMDNAFDYIEKNGIAAEADYPYTSGSGWAGFCNTSKSKATVVTLTGHTDVPKDDEDALQAAVAKQPVSIAIEADRSAFQHYKSGILDNSACGTKLDHGVLIVGYGTDNGVDYWKVKNSWGTVWGEQGYIRMVRGKNQCGIASQASYPTGAKSVGPSPPSPTPPSPTPPSPTPPGPKTHYGNPKSGCLQDETELQISGTGGVACAASCGWFKRCPHDVPAGVTAPPKCDITVNNKKKCTLSCLMGEDFACGTGGKCLPLGLGNVGFCGYTNTTSIN